MQRFLILIATALLAAPLQASEPLVPNLRFTSADGENSIALHGRFVSDVGTGAGEGDAMFRRARLGVNGKLAKDFYYKFENDFSVDNIDHGITDAYVGYNLRKGLSLKLGQFKEPFSFETLTSSRFAIFMERGITTAFVPGRRVGAMVRANGQVNEQFWTAAIGAFDGGIGVSRRADDTRDITARTSFAPIAKPGHVLHAGIAASYRTPDNPTNSISYSEQPETRFSGGDAVDSGAITDTDHAMQWGLEGVGIWGPFSLQGEAMLANVARNAGLPDAQFHAYYLQASYYLTGESRTYVTERGTFNRVAPRDAVADGGWGAWQVAARYSAIDLTDGAITGGEAQDVTLGLNWTPHQQIVIMANTVFVNTDANAVTPNDDPTLFMLRLQYDF